jgi:hypothetical protein
MQRSPMPFVLAIACLVVTPVVARAATVTIDGAPVTGVIVHEGHILVPFRVPMESLGATVDWSDATRTGTASMSGAELVRATVGQETAYIDNNPKTLTVAPVLVSGLEYVPVEMLPEISSAKLNLSADGTTATITGFDLAGVHAAGGGGGVDPQGKLLYLWVWLLPISAILCAIVFFATGVRRSAPTR